jgi:urease accessory protein
MRRAIAVRPKAGGQQDGAPAATVTLAYAERFRRRLRLRDDAGQDFLLDLERTALLADGDGLVLDDGGLICVRAAEEAVLEASGAGPAETARLAWHLGNRHTPVQVLADGTLRLLDDPVLEQMLRGLCARVERGCAPFSPEPGAYAQVHRTPASPVRPSEDHLHDHAPEP